MTITTKRTKATSKKLLMYGAIAFAAAILLTATVSSGVLAQGANTASRNTTTGTTTTTTTPTSPSQANNLPNITGSIPLRTTISGALSSKVKTNLSDAIVIAQKSVGTNTSATLGLLRPLNGYLVYDIHVRNNANNTTYAVIVDPGTGKVLYKQALPSLLDGGMGHFGMFGPGKMGPFSGAYGGGNRGGFGEHGSMTIGPSPNMGPMGSVPPRAW